MAKKSDVESWKIFVKLTIILGAMLDFVPKKDLSASVTSAGSLHLNGQHWVDKHVQDLAQ